MSISDLFSGTNKFKKGMEAGAIPFEAKFAQYGEALKRLENNYGSQWNRTMEVAEKILDSTEAAERERLYGLYTQTDIKQLKSEYKEILIAALYELSNESNNEFQQAYIRSVQKYLDIKNPQTSFVFAGIGNIDSQIAQKAIFQSCVEYLFLGDDGPAFFKKNGVNLFSLFVIKEEDKEEIWDNVLKIFSATGPVGLAEKYGFDPKVTRKQYILSDEASNDEKSILEKQIIDEVLLIKSDQEMIIEGKGIILNEDIYCEGKLTLKDCFLFYNGDNITGQILLLDDNSMLTLSNCTVVGKNNPKRNDQSEKWLIEHEEGPKAREMLNIEKYFRSKGHPKVNAEKCIFLNCLNFIEDVEVFFKDSIIRYTKIPEFIEKSYGNDSKQGIHFVNNNNFRNDTPIFLERCIVKSEDTAMASYKGEVLLCGVNCVTNCAFINITRPFSTTRWLNPDTLDFYHPIIKNSKFLNCRYPINEKGDIKNLIDPPYYGGAKGVNIIDCIFENCYNVIEIDSGSIVNCQFVKCGNFIILLRGGTELDNCQFIDIENPKDEEFSGSGKKSRIAGWGISIFCENKREGASISHCTFDGINHPGFIRFQFDEGLSLFKKFTAYSISDCEFKHCVAGIIDKGNYYYKEKEAHTNVGINISNCTGLDETGGGQAENFVIRQITDSGEPIDACIDESEVGVPIYENA
jgi:hypothetical protein